MVANLACIIRTMTIGILIASRAGMSSGAVAEQFLETLQQWQDALAPRQSERLEGSAPCRQEQRVLPGHCLWRSQAQSPRKLFFFVISANVGDRCATARGVGSDQRITLHQFLFFAVLDRTDWEHLVLLQHHHVIASICVVCRY